MVSQQMERLCRTRAYLHSAWQARQWSTLFFFSCVLIGWIWMEGEKFLGWLSYLWSGQANGTLRVIRSKSTRAMEMCEQLSFFSFSFFATNYRFYHLLRCYSLDNASGVMNGWCSFVMLAEGFGGLGLGPSLSYLWSSLYAMQFIENNSNWKFIWLIIARLRHYLSYLSFQTKRLQRKTERKEKTFCNAMKTVHVDCYYQSFSILFRENCTVVPARFSLLDANLYLKKWQFVAFLYYAKISAFYHLRFANLSCGKLQLICI